MICFYSKRAPQYHRATQRALPGRPSAWQQITHLAACLPCGATGSPLLSSLPTLARLHTLRTLLQALNASHAKHASARRSCGCTICTSPRALRLPTPLRAPTRPARFHASITYPCSLSACTATLPLTRSHGTSHLPTTSNHPLERAAGQQLQRTCYGKVPQSTTLSPGPRSAALALAPHN